MAVIAIMSVISVWQSFVLSSACQCQLWQLLLLCQLFQRGIRSLFCVQCQLLLLWQSFILLLAMSVTDIMSVTAASVAVVLSSACNVSRCCYVSYHYVSYSSVAVVSLSCLQCQSLLRSCSGLQRTKRHSIHIDTEQAPRQTEKR